MVSVARPGTDGVWPQEGRSAARARKSGRVRRRGSDEWRVLIITKDMG